MNQQRFVEINNNPFSPDNQQEFLSFVEELLETKKFRRVDKLTLERFVSYPHDRGTYQFARNVVEKFFEREC